MVRNTGQPTAEVLQRLEEIRGGAASRSPSVRALAEFSSHTDCKLAALGFAARVDFDRLLLGSPYAEPFGQSPFAFRRGIQFENQLREDGHGKTLTLLREGMKFDVNDAQVADLKKGFPRSREGMIARGKRTSELIAEIISGTRSAPNLIDGGVLSSSIGGITGYFEADAVAARFSGPIHVGEIKSFPIVDGRIDSDKLGSALDQVAIYLLLLERLIEELGGDPAKQVSRVAMLITPKNVGLEPALSVKDVGNRMVRVGRLLQQVPNVSDIVSAYPSDLSFRGVADPNHPPEKRVEELHKIADRVGTKYEPACFGSCGNARFCRERAFKAASPCLTGSTTIRLVPGVETLVRVSELSEGAAPKKDEVKAAPLLAKAGRLYDKLAPKKRGGGRERKPA